MLQSAMKKCVKNFAGKKCNKIALKNCQKKR